MFAEVVINLEAGLEGTFHYNVPFDLRDRLQPGHLVEVEFGRQMAQAIVIDRSGSSPVPHTKPIIAVIDPLPVVRPWQIALARRLSERYLTPLNLCLRLMLPPGLSRWSDQNWALHPGWNGNEADLRTPAQRALVALLREQGDLRGRQVNRQISADLRTKWRKAARQLVRRDILIQGSLLDPPRLRPKKIETAELLTDPHKIRDAVVQLGRPNKQADVLDHLWRTADPLPAEADVLAATGAGESHLAALAAASLIQRTPATELTIETPDGPGTIQEPAVIGLAIPPKAVLGHILALRGAGKYHAVLTRLAQEAQPLALSTLYAETGATRTHLDRLARLELIRYAERQVWRDSLADNDFIPADAPSLTPDQARVWEPIRAVMEAGGKSAESPRPFLLHGVTGSGKTEIYMRAVELALAQGRSAIVLVPEIALTPQTVRRFAARFPGRVAVLHSRLSEGERFDTWRRARLGLFDIIIGPRSALFTPFADPGVVIVDEEHDDSYKQTPPVPPPYYHATDSAIALAQQNRATIILGSATPDLVTYHRGMADHYHLLTLPRRVMGHRRRIDDQMARTGRATAFRPLDAPSDRASSDAASSDDALAIGLPPVTVVDMRQELRAGNRAVFSRLLQREMDGVLARREQAILFLNRRGSASHVFCRDCGHVLHCPRCDTPLTWHSPQARLTCHTCSHQEPEPQRCPACDSARIRYFGLGTEQLEALVQERWPQARLVRWDRDTTAGRDTHEQLLASFIRHESDILIGTQMIAKGLDLPLVTLVGVISADTSLNLPDFRTGERTFQILTQVAGRAGRSLLGGRVVLQTYQPDHYAIRAAADHDFASFYLEEIAFRTRHRLPPFRRMAKVVCSDPDTRRAERMARELLAQLQDNVRERELAATELIGPVPPFFSRIDRRWRWQIVIRSADPARVLEGVALPIGCMIDIDPVSTL
jgi:primosomal protein N' (replication factor Y)